MNKIDEKLLKIWTDAGLPAEQFSLDMPSIVFAMRTSIGRARIARQKEMDNEEHHDSLE